MDGQFDHNEFEHFLKQNADAHRLYPSDRVWARIHKRLHGRRRMVAFLLLLPLLAGLGWFVAKQVGGHSTSGVNPPDTVLSATNSLGATDANRTATLATPEDNAPAHTNSNDAIVENPAPRISQKSPLTVVAASTKTLVKKTVNTIGSEDPADQAAFPTSHFSSTSTDNSPSEITLQATSDVGKADNRTAAETTLLAPRKQAESEEGLPLDIESVVNSYQRQLHRPRFRWQLHFTPTVSYRSLKEDQKFIAQARMNTASSTAPMANSTDLASVIRHRPDIGMQLGITGTYPISKKLDWVTGIQFNVSKYDIAAYNYPSEVATIALMNSWGGTSTVSTLTSFRSSGFRSTASWLRNYYYSVSLPIGLQWRVLGKKQTHWGISATVQPTYMVGNRSYVISVDYQNYAEVPYLINKWNLNVGLETYARFQLGKTDFQVGPQLRYQALSSFKKGYPVQEHLYDFGIKLGIRLGK